MLGPCWSCLAQGLYPNGRLNLYLMAKFMGTRGYDGMMRFRPKHQTGIGRKSLAADGRAGAPPEPCRAVPCRVVPGRKGAGQGARAGSRAGRRESPDTRDFQTYK